MAIRTPDQHEEIRGISLCAGVAGLDLGVHIAEPGYRTVCYVERNSFGAAALVARMADASLAPAPIWDDLKSFDGHPWRGKVHLVTAGYPCQPFTLSGQRKGEADPRHLWPDVARIISEVRPAMCFFENVPGHLTLGLQDVVGDLQGMGYRVAARVVSVTKRRKRTNSEYCRVTVGKAFEELPRGLRVLRRSFFPRFATYTAW